MKRWALVIFVLIILGYLMGCAKKQEAFENMPEPLPIEDIVALSDAKTTPEAGVSVTQSAAPITETRLEPLPPPIAYKPTSKQIQTALRNANFYTGLIDGKIGPMTKKAIEDFQRANGLKVDGVVGLKTWSKLSAYLNPPIVSESNKKR